MHCFAAFSCRDGSGCAVFRRGTATSHLTSSSIRSCSDRGATSRPRLSEIKGVQDNFWHRPARRVHDRHREADVHIQGWRRKNISVMDMRNGLAFAHRRGARRLPVTSNSRVLLTRATAAATSSAAAAAASNISSSESNSNSNSSNRTSSPKGRRERACPTRTCAVGRLPVATSVSPAAVRSKGRCSHPGVGAKEHPRRQFAQCFDCAVAFPLCLQPCAAKADIHTQVGYERTSSAWTCAVGRLSAAIAASLAAMRGKGRRSHPGAGAREHFRSSISGVDRFRDAMRSCSTIPRCSTMPRGHALAKLRQRCRLYYSVRTELGKFFDVSGGHEATHAFYAMPICSPQQLLTQQLTHPPLSSTHGASERNVKRGGPPHPGTELLLAPRQFRGELRDLIHHPSCHTLAWLLRRQQITRRWAAAARARGSASPAGSKPPRPLFFTS